MTDQISSPLDDAQRQFTAELLTGAADEIALRAARALLAAEPDLADRYRPLPLQKWRASFVGRLGDLSIAVATGRPEMFADQLAWTVVAHRARNVPIGDVRAGLEALRDATMPEVPEPDRDLVAPFFDAALQRIAADEPDPPSDISTRTPHGRLAASYLLALLEGDRRRASGIILDQVESGKLEVCDAYEQVLLPVQRELGRLWHLNEATVGEEHFATATTQLVISQLYRHLRPRLSNGRVFVAGTVDGNTHDIGLRMISDYFEMDGWRSIYLGASVPAEDIAVSAQHFNADLIGLSATMHTQLRRLEDAIVSIRRTTTDKPFRIIVGGGAFAGLPDLWRDIGADGYAQGLRQAVEVGNRLVGLD